MGTANAIYQYLDANGDGTGATTANGNYSDAGVGVTQFYYEATNYAEIERMIIYVEDTVGFAAADYGSITGNLTNGISLKVFDTNGTTELLDLTAGLPVKSNAGWARTCYDAQLLEWGAGNEMLLARWTFSKAGDSINLLPGQRLAVVMNDDLTGLVDHNFMIQGQFTAKL